MKTHSASLIFMSALLFLLLSLTIHTRAEVITLTADTFSDKVIEGEDEIEIGEVDCSTSKPVCSKVDIHSYPTFKLFYDGEEVAKYQGPRDVESLKTFVLEEAEKAATKSQLDSDKELCDLRVEPALVHIVTDCRYMLLWTAAHLQ
ncbi:PDI-like 5-1 [Prunus dulcis]|uniref:PDI-like 5-1 n=1 Tax=Prunus dulcis TaxID=3755 RepID=A0A4Y1RLZ3_PRUDU|nr:PDI-like 5-1 [Prunus dulcis]